MPNAGSPNVETLNTANTADIAMVLAFEHHTIHREVLIKKLRHAQSATKKSLQKISELSEQHQPGTGSKEFKEIKKCGELWESAIRLFQNSYVSDEALEKIEGVLLAIPKLIKKYYDALVAQDDGLQEMLQELASQKYQEALKLIGDIQSKPCPMSKLAPKEFDVVDDLEETNVRAFKIVPPNLTTVKS